MTKPIGHSWQVGMATQLTFNKLAKLGNLASYPHPQIQGSLFDSHIGRFLHHIQLYSGYCKSKHIMESRFTIIHR